MRIACWIPKATNTRSEYVVVIALLLQQMLHELASVFRYTYKACLTKKYMKQSPQREVLIHKYVVAKYTRISLSAVYATLQLSRRHN